MTPSHWLGLVVAGVGGAADGSGAAPSVRAPYLRRAQQRGGTVLVPGWRRLRVLAAAHAVDQRADQTGAPR